MIEFLRLLISISSHVKVAECCICHAVHKVIHGFQIILNQCLHEMTVRRIFILKPSGKHLKEHNAGFQISNF